MMKKSLYLLILVFASVQVSAQDHTGIHFFKGSMSEAFAEAQATGKLIYLDAYTVWCGPCKWMSANVYTEEAVGKYFNENFINVKLDMEKGEGPGFAQKYRVRAYPTHLFLNGKGQEVHRELGAKQAEGFLQMGKKVIAANSGS